MATGMDLADAGIARARGAAEVARPGWTDECMYWLRYYVRRNPRPFAFEQFRAFLMRNRPELEPPSPNCWGALSREGVKREIIKPTGGYRLAASKATHGHPVRLLVRFRP